MTSIPGTLVISLDFELMWGVRDHRSVADYGDAVLGGRAAIPEILERFQRAGIHATWATVGLLFARNRREMQDFAPALKPDYVNSHLSPYVSVEREIGEDEKADPLHFGRSLLGQISSTDGQEIATHTYSHYYCLEAGSSLETFDADIGAAVAIARHNEIRLTSIVFPRNQMTTGHIKVCANHGITTYRGNSGRFAYRSRSGADTTLFVRAYRLVDSVWPVTGAQTYELNATDGETANIPASRFLRTYPSKLEFLSDSHLKRIMTEMEVAARRGDMYHLWWHPHNFGRNTKKRLSQLDRLLRLYTRLSAEHGMRSLTMAELASQGLSAPVIENAD